jgi:hypothetical protein
MQSFFSLSPQFYRLQNFIIVIYLFAVLDLVTTFVNIRLGLSEVNVIGQSLLNDPVLLIAWRIAFLTILLVFPYWLSGRVNESRGTELITYCFWWVLVFLSVLPVGYNVVLGVNELNHITQYAIRALKTPALL